MFEFWKRWLGRGSAEESGRVGSNADPIRQMLFASQSLEEQVSRMRPNVSAGPLRSLTDAHRLAVEGKRSEALACLRSVLEVPTLETRVQLWVWSALRELGAKPEGKAAFEVLGAVLEMPQQGAYDTLAGYTDGSARYLNFSGSSIIWDAADPMIQKLCQDLIDSTIPASRRAKLRTSLSLPKRGVQVTMLTRSGPFVIAEPPQTVVAAGGTLMSELIRRAGPGGGN